MKLLEVKNTSYRAYKSYYGYDPKTQEVGYKPCFVTEEYKLPLLIRNKYINRRYNFNNEFQRAFTFYRTYSRMIESEKRQETWGDVCLRCVEGSLSYRKNHMVNSGLHWNDNEWDDFATEMIDMMWDFKWLPPGRGLWCAGTDYVKRKGGMALTNCAFTEMNNPPKDLCFVKDSLMSGCGVGIKLNWSGDTVIPNKETKTKFVIPDTREGWVDSVYHLLSAYMPDEHGKVVVFPEFDYSLIRKEGEKIAGFGGTSGGPKPLMKLHRRIEIFCDTRNIYKILSEGKQIIEDYKNKQTDPRTYIEPYQAFIYYLYAMYELEYDKMFEGDNFKPYHTLGEIESIIKIYEAHKEEKVYDVMRLLADICNAIGVCVVAGNVRRSAEILLGKANDNNFKNLKRCIDYIDNKIVFLINAERYHISWMSNNTVQMSCKEDFLTLNDIIERNILNGEPGIANMINVGKYGKFGKAPGIYSWGTLRKDEATGFNPCVTAETMILTDQGEIPVSELINKPFTAVVNGMKNVSTDQGFYSQGTKDIIKIKLDNGRYLRGSKNHQILTIKNGISIYDEMENIKVGDKLFINCRDFYEAAKSNNNSSTVISVENDGREEVYDCTILGNNCYVANGIIVHNCGEISLPDKGVCILSEVIPHYCKVDGEFNEEIYYKACKYAAFFATSVCLVKTHNPETNAVIRQEQRIGISINGFMYFYETVDQARCVNSLRQGYKEIRICTSKWAKEAGVNEPIRVTTIKPSGTTALVAGISCGMHAPYSRYTIRTIRVGKSTSFAKFIIKSGYPYHEAGSGEDCTVIFEMPMCQDICQGADECGFMYQLMIQQLLQANWADNAVSATITFKKSEIEQLRLVLPIAIQFLKSVSFLPECTKVYKFAPYTTINKHEYDEAVKKFSKYHIDWSNYGDGDGEEPLYCEGDKCIRI